ncbi:MAG: hypothetical protein FKY71_05055 [Spiribacter salinus]|uniref:Squalene cyclase C-terminal domain-containing protein n=1 Tax=Spiribacter salinus TaxID=1335746 RepID=A0A540VTM7_9GAMM|nr:MAG: hypothetical protein FKY71_05055 [Spiribacter salinus]
MLSRLLRHGSRMLEARRLPAAAREAMAQDRAGALGSDPGAPEAVRLGMQWLARAQDKSASADGGVARDFSLVNGWATSYPETTGYIVPTFLDYARRFDDSEAEQRARRMLDWLVAIQLPDGAFQGGRIDSEPVVPVTFNTGQILLGLAAGALRFGEPYRTAARRAADWLVETQEANGSWVRFPTPFAQPGLKTYETHVAWGLFEAARALEEPRYATTARANVDWALGYQRPNGWFEHCCLSEPERPLTHTLGYVLRGLVEAHRYTGDASLLAAARRTADGLLGTQQSDGSLPGRLTETWQAAVDYSCLTGNVQIAWCWFYLASEAGEERYDVAARRANAYVRRTLQCAGDPDRVGGVKGSFPVSGGYGRFEYLNWAAKFMVDANLAEVDREGGMRQTQQGRMAEA